MAPVSIWISLAGSPIEAALICSAQGDPAFDPVDGRVIGLILWFIGAAFDPMTNVPECDGSDPQPDSFPANCNYFMNYPCTCAKLDRAGQGS
jgi:hypothetical protein